MAEMTKVGETKTAANTKKAARKAATPKLRCIVTGNERFTNAEYLEGKVATAGSINRFCSHYVCKDAMKLMRPLAERIGQSAAEATKVITEIRAKMKIKDPTAENPWTAPTQSQLQIALKTNGKHAAPKTAKPAKTPAAKPAKTAKPAAPKAPVAPAPKAPTAPVDVKAPAVTAPAVPIAH